MNLIIFSSLLSLVEAVQVLLCAWHLASLKPLALFSLFMACLIAGQWLLMWYLKPRWGDTHARLAARRYLTVEAVLSGLLLSASYKLVIYDFQPQLAARAFIVLVIAAVLNKIFWRKIQGFLVSLYAFLTEPSNRQALTFMIDIGFVIFLGLFIYVPDVKAVLARMVVGDQLHHFDLFMAPAWANLKGCISYVDLISQYGVGLPILMAYGSKLFGGFSYEHVLTLLVVLCIIYYAAVYVFLRCWLKSIPIVLVAMAVGLKTQMFHTGVAPFVFSYPSTTVSRNYIDIFFFLCIWGHLHTGRRLWLWLAAFLSALAEFNLTDTGVYLIGTFYAYLFLIVGLPELRRRFLCGQRDYVHMAGCFLTPPMAVLLLFYAVAGSHVFTKLYWQNMAEYIIYFISGAGPATTIPFSESFYYHFFWAAMIGLLFPLVYLSTFLVLGLLCYERRISSSHVLVMVICVYGLGLYHYYVVRTAVTSYYVSGLPFIFVICFWLQKLLERINDGPRLKILLGLVLFCWFCLWTNHQVLAYPNIFNFSRNPMVDPLVRYPGPDQRGYFNNMFTKYAEDHKLPFNSLGEKDEGLVNERDFDNDDQLKKFYEEEFDFSQDARLIDAFTAPGQKAAILSSFETRILMQADRKPFFYFTPVFMSHPIRMRIWPLEGSHSAAYLKKTMQQLQDQKPPFIFMEKLFWETPVPVAYKDDYPRLLVMVQYIRSHYVPYAYGRYLVAMKLQP